MTTEETELTFIRCPDCRSLVPAIASRCRMCGHQFDGGSDETPSESVGQKSRIRQRTISVSQQEAGAVRSDIASGSQVETEPDEPAVDESPFRLGADGASGNEPEELDASSSRAFEEDQTFDPEDFEPPAEKEALAESQDETPVDDFPVLDDFGANEPDNVDDVGFEPAEAKNWEKTMGETPEQMGAQDNEAAESSERKPRKKRRRRKKKSRRALHEGDQVEAGIGGPSSEAEAVVADKVDSTGESAMEQVDQHPREMDQVRSREKSRKPVSEVQPSIVPEGQTGMLFGWLVSFTPNEKGVGSELRSGQFFVGQQRLRDSDMVIPEESVSTPHCLVSVSEDLGLRVQDLMSENGTFVKRCGQDSYERIGIPTEVKHGDWLRFGSYELMVCLVPFPNRK